MSYNESLKPNSNYPLMSQSEWDNAPFNQPETEEEDFNITVSYSLSKELPIKSTEYSEDDYGNHVLEDPHKEFVENHMELPDIIAFAKTSAEYLLNIPYKALSYNDKKALKEIIKGCEGWTVDEFNVEQV